MSSSETPELDRRQSGGKPPKRQRHGGAARSQRAVAQDFHFTRPTPDIQQPLSRPASSHSARSRKVRARCNRHQRGFPGSLPPFSLLATSLGSVPGQNAGMQVKGVDGAGIVRAEDVDRNDAGSACNLEPRFREKRALLTTLAAKPLPTSLSPPTRRLVPKTTPAP